MSDLADAFEFFWRVEAPDDAPSFEREQCLIDGRKWRCDVVFRSARLVVEIDGGEYASGGGRHARPADKEKHNALTEAGWRVLHYSGSQLTGDPAAVVAQVVRCLKTSGE